MSAPVRSRRAARRSRQRWHVALPIRSVRSPRSRRRDRSAQAVPGGEQAAHARRQPGRRLGQEQVEEGLDLRPMRAVLLHIGLPDEGRARPEGPDQRILAAHEVEVAGPEQAVEVDLRERRQRDRAQPAASAGRSEAGRAPDRAAAPGVRRSRVGAARQGIEQRIDRRVRIAEQADAALVGLRGRCRGRRARRVRRRRPAGARAASARAASRRCLRRSRDRRTSSARTRPWP